MRRPQHPGAHCRSRGRLRPRWRRHRIRPLRAVGPRPVRRSWNVRPRYNWHRSDRHWQPTGCEARRRQWRPVVCGLRRRSRRRQRWRRPGCRSCAARRWSSDVGAAMHAPFGLAARSSGRRRIERGSLGQRREVVVQRRRLTDVHTLNCCALVRNRPIRRRPPLRRPARPGVVGRQRGTTRIDLWWRRRHRRRWWWQQRHAPTVRT